MYRFFLVAGLMLLTTGCGSSTKGFQQEITAAKAANEQLRAEVKALKNELGKALKNVEAANKSTAKQLTESQELNQELGKAWTIFKDSYSPEMQKTLVENVEATDKAQQLAAKTAKSSAEALADMKKVVAEANKLKQECAEHAQEAAALNELGNVKSLAVQNQRGLKSIESKLSNVETMAKRARQKAEEADRTAESAETDARRAKRKADQAYNRAKRN